MATRSDLWLLYRKFKSKCRLSLPMLYFTKHQIDTLIEILHDEYMFAQGDHNPCDTCANGGAPCSRCVWNKEDMYLPNMEEDLNGKEEK